MSGRPAGTAVAYLLPLLAIAAIAGCGLGAGPAPTAVQLTVTRDFGAHAMRSWSAPKVRGQETVMSLLARNAAITTRYGGGFVESIDGFSGGSERGQPVDWFYYVNGVEAPKGAAATNVHPGDHLWWDRHDWSQTDEVPAVVGSFPEPFQNGYEGRRLPVRVECATVAGYACQTVTARLRSYGVPAAIAQIGSGGEPETLRVMVGPWVALLGEATLRDLESGPSASGVYVRFSPEGSKVTVLDEDGRAVRTLEAGAGLIAATRTGEAAPVWIVTGTDARGVDLAAGSFTQRALHDRFAVAISPSGTLLAAPAPDGGQ